MGDIPGLDYESPVAVDRAKLPHHNAVPQVRRFEFDGHTRESLLWDYPDDEQRSGTSASPAHGVAFSGGDDRELSTTAVLARLWEGLELPGLPSDYHFAIQGVASTLWGRRRAEPEVLEWFECLNLLDLRLIQAAPDAVRDEFAGDQSDRAEFYRVPAFDNVIGLYSREGFLQEAQRIAALAKRFGQGEVGVELNERFGALKVEDGN